MLRWSDPLGIGNQAPRRARRPTCAPGALRRSTRQARDESTTLYGLQGDFSTRGTVRTCNVRSRVRDCARGRGLGSRYLPRGQTGAFQFAMSARGMLLAEMPAFIETDIKKGESSWWTHFVPGGYRSVDCCGGLPDFKYRTVWNPAPAYAPGLVEHRNGCTPYASWPEN